MSELAEALQSCHLALTTTSRDTGEGRDVAWLYGLLVGWECEDNHEHDDICGGSAALFEIAERHGWNTPEEVGRHRRLRAAIRLAGDEAEDDR